MLNPRNGMPSVTGANRVASSFGVRHRRSAKKHRISAGRLCNVDLSSADIALEEITMTAGVAVGNRPTLKVRFQHGAEGVMDNPGAERRGADSPTLGFARLFPAPVTQGVEQRPVVLAQGIPPRFVALPPALRFWHRHTGRWPLRPVAHHQRQIGCGTFDKK